MAYWLLKSEPTSFSIDDLIIAPNQTTFWNGVRNYQARNMLRDEMKIGDRGFFYQSNCDFPGIVGIVEVVNAGYPDDTAFDKQSPYYDAKSTPDKPIWYMVDVHLIKKFSQLISLKIIKQHPKLCTMLINRKGNRLSITPVTKEEWKIILDIENQTYKNMI